MSGGTYALSFGANMGFAHMYCDTCKEERLHKHCHCVSCHTPHSTAKYRRFEWQPRNPGELNVRQRKAQALKVKASSLPILNRP